MSTYNNTLNKRKEKEVEIDVRESAEVTKIRFSDTHDDEDIGMGDAVFLDKAAGRVYINDFIGHAVAIRTKEHAINLIKALEKAIELGWLK